MQKLIDTLKSFGIEIPGDKQADVKSALSEHYKNAGEVTKTLSKVENERDSWKIRAEAAETTLKSFDGVDVDGMKQSIADWKAKAEKAEQDAKDQLYQRDFADALKTELESVKFSSEAAKKAIMADIKEAGLTMKNGKILGLNDLIEQMKKEDASAFVDDSQQKAQQNAAKFTTSVQKGSGTGGTITKEDFKKMNLDERLKLKQSDPDLFAALNK
mgnify:CR=1 FL=1